MSINFANISFSGLKKSNLFLNDKYQHIITANAEIIVCANRDHRMLSILNSNVTTVDGQLPFLMIKMRNPHINIEKISGSDFIYDVAQYCKDNKGRLFLLGGAENVNYKAVEALRQKYDISVEGYSPPYSSYPFRCEVNDIIKQKISSFRPDFLFVGFGAIKQELWIEDNRDFLKENRIRMAVGSGGAFDFVSGTKKRAPKFLQKICLEGVYRMIVEFKWFRIKRLLKSLLLFKYVFSEIIINQEKKK